MSFSNQNTNNFSGGEGSPLMAARSDLPVEKSIYRRVENWVAFLQGPIVFRPGTLFVNHTRLGQLTYFIPFVFNDDQAYLCEFSNGYIRFYKNGGVIVNTPTTITGITNASPAVVHDVAHGYSTGAEVFISGVQGMTQINGSYYIVTVIDADHYSLTDIYNNPIDTTSYGVYTSGGIAESIYEIISPYAIADVPEVEYAQNADVMYLVHRGYAPRKLVRTSDTNWTIGTFSRTADPFTGAGDWPGAISFTSDLRLLYAGTSNNPEQFWGSMTPASNGASRYDDFTLGTNLANAYTYHLAPLNGEVDSIRWVSHTNTYMVMGTFGSIRQLYGSALGQPVTPLAVTVVPIDSYGAARTLPASLGVNMLYIQKNFIKLRSIEFDIYINAYQSIDRTLVAEQIGQKGLLKVIVQHTNIDIIWAVGQDGNLYGLTFDIKEQKYAWHRHSLGGDGFLIDAGILYQASGLDQLWLIVQRTINGNQITQIEYFSPQPIYYDPLDFFTTVDNQTSDLKNYHNAMYELQKQAVHMDCATIYDGSVAGADANITMTPGAGANVKGTTGVTFTASANFFTASMVTQQIWKKYIPTGQGGGRFRIDTYVSPTQVTGTILSAFDNVTTIPVGYWYLTARHFTGLNYLEGESVVVVADGAMVGNGIDPIIVTNGAVDIGYNASVVQFGLSYTGVLQTFPIDQGGTTGPAQAKMKRVAKMAIRVTNTVGISMSTNDPYNAEKLSFRYGQQQTDRPIPLWTGVIGPMQGSAGQTYGSDSWTSDKSVLLLQTLPLPATINSIDVFADTSDES
jgi:hypothetical protein